MLSRQMFLAFRVLSPSFRYENAFLFPLVGMKNNLAIYRYSDFVIDVRLYNMHG